MSRMSPTRLALGLAAMSMPAWAAEWRTEADPRAPAVVAVPLDALAAAGGLRLDAARTTTDTDRDLWIELRLIAADGRRYSAAMPLRIASGERTASTSVGLDAGSWAGDDGPLGADALAAVASFEVAVHGSSERILARVEPLPARGGNPAFSVVQLQDGLVAVDAPAAAGGAAAIAWREWRLRLAGSIDAERGELDLVDAAGRRWPMFLDQAGGPDEAGRWHAHGPARWVLRLGAGEQPQAPAVLAWSEGERTWRSAPLAVPSAVAAVHEAPPGPSSCELPVPRSAAWSADVYRLDGDAWVRLARQDTPEALAPVLAWRGDWSGFRGPNAVSWPQAAALDRLAVAGIRTVDLLPDGLADEQGPFRFGLSPWTGPVWKGPRDIWSDDRPWQAWNAHVRTVVARLRAAPGLEQWTLGAERAATGDAQRARLATVATGIARLVATIDPRPLRARHAQLAAFKRTDPQGAWYGFADGAAGWSLGPAPLAGPVLTDAGGSDGNGCIAAQVPPGADPRVVGVKVPLDVNLANLDRLEFDAAQDGGGETTLFAWISDHHHRWWQQRLVRIPGDGAWQTVGVDFSAGGAWTCASTGAVWSDDVRRRVRSMGVVAYVRGAAAQARLRIDRVRRMGWPQTAAAAELSIAGLAAASTLPRWTPIEAEFRLSLTPVNPYDPDEADVVGEVEGPDGARASHPAYWFEPFKLDFDGSTERALPDGEGRWRWRWTPSAAGNWRWRIVARVKSRGEWRQTASEWRDIAITGAPGGMMPVRVDQKDRRWLAYQDGRFWYPVGLNLRSPGDERQDGNLARERAFKPLDQEPADIRGWRSNDWQRRGTRAYERWFPLMKANGMDWARVWMCPWWCGLEWRRDWDDYGGLGWYSQANAARMDRVMELAAANGVYVQVELMNHGMVGEHADRQWQDSPYNKANGGPCRRSSEWFRSDEVWKWHEKRLRYTVARWGGCTNLAAWVLSSEMEFSGTFRLESGEQDLGHSPSIERWVRKCLEWMRTHDVFPDRPVSIHFSHPWSDPQMWKTEGLGFSNSNAYTAFQDFDPTLGRGQRGRRDLPLALEAYLEDLFPPKQLNRPTLVGEWGGHWETNEPWTLRGELRTGLWIQACTPYAANTGFWWWLWLDVADKWAEYAPISRFMAGEDPRGRAWTTFRPGVRNGGGRVQAIGMRCDGAMRLYAWPRGVDQDSRLPLPQGQSEIVIDAAGAGSRWRVQRYDCTTGSVASTAEVAVDAAGRLVIAGVTTAPDAAFKLTRLP